MSSWAVTSGGSESWSEERPVDAVSVSWPKWSIGYRLALERKGGHVNPADRKPRPANGK